MYKSFAEAVAINIDWDAVRRSHIAWLETQVVQLSTAYKAAREAGSPDAAELRTAGIAMKRRLDMAVAREVR